MNQKQRMLEGLAYKCDEVLKKEITEAREFCFKYNNISPVEKIKKETMLKNFLGKTGEKITIMSPFYCDYGYNIEIGENFFSNYNLTILDICPVKIGDNVMFGPNVSLYGAGHPIHAISRNSGYEYGDKITIGDNVWLGGSVVVVPGVTIGENTVIAAGSVVTKDIPKNVVAAGNPCKVIKEITDKDLDYYYKNKKFDVDDYK